MVDRPILFSAPMIRALLGGRKTQTRRIFVPPVPFDIDDDITIELATGSIKPCWSVGDRLWVREQFSAPHSMGDIPPRDWADSVRIWYWADGDPDNGDWTRPKPSIHMPRIFSRLTLDVTDVRVERLHDISTEDAIAEGPEWVAPTYGISGLASTWHADPIKSYAALWEAINGTGSWALNPWIAATTFTVHRTNIDALIALDQENAK